MKEYDLLLEWSEVEVVFGREDRRGSAFELDPESLMGNWVASFRDPFVVEAWLAEFTSFVFICVSTSSSVSDE